MSKIFVDTLKKGVNKIEKNVEKIVEAIPDDSQIMTKVQNKLKKLTTKLLK